MVVAAVITAAFGYQVPNSSASSACPASSACSAPPSSPAQDPRMQR
ncbi:hypothetical protein ACFOOM_25020 [Streptomyces echinoruber]|nr:hypothetical protein [Streptomyces echinoruber]